MKYIWIGLVILIGSCNSDQKTEEAIYNEYITTFYNAYVRTKSETPEIIEPNWEKGDTIYRWVLKIHFFTCDSREIAKPVKRFS